MKFYRHHLTVNGKRKQLVIEREKERTCEARQVQSRAVNSEERKIKKEEQEGCKKKSALVHLVFEDLLTHWAHLSLKVQVIIV